MLTLGVNAAFHDGAAALVRSGLPALAMAGGEALAPSWTSPLDTLSIGPFLVERPR